MLDFINYDDFKRENDGKLVVILYGNCHMTAIRDVLNSVSDFNDKYVIYPIKAIQEIRDTSYFDIEVFKDCDVFIHQSIQDENRYGYEYSSSNIIKKLKKNCVIISVPNLYHLPVCFFPQYVENKELVYRGVTFFYYDSIIVNNLDLCFDELVDLYMSNKSIQSCNWDEELNVFFKKVSEREKKWDIKILDYLLNQYRFEQLFLDPNHPSQLLINEISMRLLSYMNINYDECRVKSFQGLRLDAYEMPMLFCVKEKYDIVYSAEKIRYSNSGRKICNKEMDVREYIRQFLALIWTSDDFSIGQRIKSFCSFLNYRLVSLIKKYL